MQWIERGRMVQTTVGRKQTEDSKRGSKGKKQGSRGFSYREDKGDRCELGKTEKQRGNGKNKKRLKKEQKRKARGTRNATGHRYATR